MPEMRSRVFIRYARSVDARRSLPDRIEEWVSIEFRIENRSDSRCPRPKTHGLECTQDMMYSRFNCTRLIVSKETIFAHTCGPLECNATTSDNLSLRSTTWETRQAVYHLPSRSYPSRWGITPHLVECHCPWMASQTLQR